MNSGARPSDLRIEQVTKLDLIVDLNAAQTIGLTITRGGLLSVDEVIQ
jgi:putative tryptophan/tyrosine transport system substrate-binding protein